MLAPDRCNLTAAICRTTLQDAPEVKSGPTGGTKGTYSTLSVTMVPPEAYGLGKTLGSRWLCGSSAAWS